MKAHIFSNGDSSVGIQGRVGFIDIGVEFEDDDERNDNRCAIAQLFSDLWSEPAIVLFDDEEFEDSGKIRLKQLQKPPTKGPGHYLVSPKNGGKPYVSTTAPDSWELRECEIQWVPELSVTHVN